MSSGSHDANAEGRLIENVWCAAYDLRKAIERALEGHRGMAASDAQIIREIESGLRGCGFRVIKER